MLILCRFFIITCISGSASYHPVIACLNLLKDNCVSDSTSFLLSRPFLKFKGSVLFCHGHFCQNKITSILLCAQKVKRSSECYLKTKKWSCLYSQDLNLSVPANVLAQLWLQKTTDLT